MVQKIQERGKQNNTKAEAVQQEILYRNKMYPQN